MDTRTGTLLRQDWFSNTAKSVMEVFEIERLPKKDCSDCGGKGWRGRDEGGRVIPCHCVGEVHLLSEPKADAVQAAKNLSDCFGKRERWRRQGWSPRDAFKK